MGTRTGSFTSRNGHDYQVQLVGDSVVSGTIELGVPPVVISMAAGEHKHCGFKSTTATVNILTDTPLVDLYSSEPTDIRLKVIDMSMGKVEYDGYVVPFAFDQPYTGLLDTVTVNAVDMITAHKGVKYENVGSAHGVDAKAIDLVLEIARRSGVMKVVEHINFNGTSDIDDSPLNVMVAQAGFLQDEVGDLDALSAISKFFGLTAAMTGDTLYLYDEHCYLHADARHATNANVYTYVSGWRKVHYFNSSSTPLKSQNVADTHNDISVTIERAYDGIQITPEGSEVSVLLPDVCGKENAVANNDSRGAETRTYQNVTENSDYMQYRTPRQSTVMDFGVDVNGVPTDTWGNYQEDAVVSRSWSNGAMLLDVTHLARKRWQDYGRGKEIIGTSVAAEGNMVWVRGTFRTGSSTVRAVVGRQKASTCYSHTNGHVKLTLECKLMRDGNWIDITSPNEQGVTGAEVGDLSFLKILCGSVRYERDSLYPDDIWVSDTLGSSHFYTDGAATTLLPTINNRKGDTTFMVPNDGQIRVAIGWTDSPALIYSSAYGSGWNLYITRLSLEGYGDAVNTACDGLRHRFNPRGGDYLTASTLLTTRHSDSTGGVGTGMNARPGVVTGSWWSGGYMGRRPSEMIPIGGILMEQLKERYRVPRISYRMTVDGSIKPYAAVNYGGTAYTVEAYDRDIYEDCTTIVID